MEEGTPFGRYRLLESLGGGGMGKVWRAFDTVTNRMVAVKVLSAHLASDPAFEQRFRREAFAAAGLNNPHVIPIHTFGEIEGRLYVDMRLIEGRDLQSVIAADGPLEPARAVRIIGEVAKALNAAHRIGLVHRDVKPSNILLDEDDFAYLIDFGIARAAGETGLTTTGAVIGTWQYMAPERLGVSDVDARADIYALACVLYESLTGRRPFPGDSVESQVAGHLTAPPPRPSSTNPGVPAEFDAVIATGMAKDPEKRYPTTVDLARAAQGAITTPMTRPLPQPPLPPTESGPLSVPPTEHDRPKRRGAHLDPAAATHRRSPTNPNRQAPQFLSSGPAPAEGESAPQPSPRGKATGISAAIAGLRRRWQTSTWFASVAIIGVILIGGLIVFTVVQSSKSPNTSTPAAPTSTPATPVQDSGNETIADYIAKSNLQETTVSRGTPGAPTIDLPVPDGWTPIPEGAEGLYGGIVAKAPTDPNDPPKIIATLVKLTGDADPYKLLSVAPGEVRNLPGYKGGDGQVSTLSGYPASRLGGSYTKNGVTRMIAQNTVVIENASGFYVLQLNAEGPEADADALKAATGVIVQKTAIKP
ncbi:LpqN/LpqT family lipoprotein [Mycolicibacterium wolinskyi]|uniref:LpqN/LpqT family lipoprotein n=1 Tax=Mycolicibacterium wolinskyi TaxID=59750 RepID=UPI0039177A5C